MPQTRQPKLSAGYLAAVAKVEEEKRAREAVKTAREAVKRAREAEEQKKLKEEKAKAKLEYLATLRPFCEDEILFRTFILDCVQSICSSLEAISMSVAELTCRMESLESSLERVEDGMEKVEECMGVSDNSGLLHFRAKYLPKSYD